MKIAFDVHGVIDTYPDIIYPMIKLLLKIGNEICIVSGPSKDLIHKDLQKLKFNDGIKNYKHLVIYSVVDYLKIDGVKTWTDDKGDVWTDDQNWWNSKARICKTFDIDLIIDDSEKYRSAFKLIKCKFINVNELI